MKRRIFFVILLLCFVSFLFPQFNKVKLPKYHGYVSDFSEILSDKTKSKLEEIISELEQKTSVEIAVVTISYLDGTTIEDYSVNLFEEWGIGKKSKNNGILFITAVGDKKVRIEVGYGLEGVINDGLVGEILDKYVLPHYRNNDFDTGIFLGIIFIAKIIAKEYNVHLDSLNNVQDKVLHYETQERISLLQVVFSVVFIIFLMYLFIRHPILFFILLNSHSFGNKGFGRGGFGGWGGFGGFGGGLSGGGGASRRW